MNEYIVNSLASFKKAIEAQQLLFNEHKYLHIKINCNKRTLTQDALVHCWYKDIGDYEGNHEEHVKNACKYQFGLSVLSKYQDYTEYINMIREKLRPMDYDDRIEFMKYVKVTSLMSTAQHAEYMNIIKDFYEQNGVFLKSKKEL